MIKVVAKNYMKSDRLSEVIDLCKELVEETRKEDGCIKYELYQDSEDSSILTMIEEWESKEALDLHLKSEHFTRIVPMMSEMTEKDGEMNIYTKLA